MKRTTALIATLLALVVVALPSVASAASLNVRAASLATVTATRCDDAIEVRPDAAQGVVAAGYTTAFEVRGIAAACAGKPLKVAVFSRTGALLGEGAVPAAQVVGSTAKVTLTPVNPRGVFLPDVHGAAATTGTWGVPATWTLPGNALPAVLCIAPVGCEISYTLPTNTESQASVRVVQGIHFVDGGTVLINLGALEIQEAQRAYISSQSFLTSARVTSCDGRFVTAEFSSFLQATFTVTANQETTGAFQCTRP